MALRDLAQRGYFKDANFINYLKYLLYWKDAEYARYLKYPMCLYFLDLLQYEHFRRELVNAHCSKFIDEQQVLLWQHYTRRRTRLLQNRADALQNHCNASGGMPTGAATNNLNASSATPPSNSTPNSNSNSATVPVSISNNIGGANSTNNNGIDIGAVRIKTE
ncbi:mediator of RNA polymerase II transcription subunit 31 isoform X2 [Nilaparvata lugens]|uniref:mediator of RNA polymerase II transcription subunit 31 isoform X2 n=1 Tax=Nilaparvata lugens TaxID=108931 RepID=UPI00193CD119|nr:mediator of RNA polymerase II transcription subunit 31 isoform X2 [Nilaparvata lugens]